MVWVSCDYPCYLKGLGVTTMLSSTIGRGCGVGVM